MVMSRRIWVNSYSLFLFVLIAVFDLNPSALARDEYDGEPIQGMIHSQDAFSGCAGRSVESARPATGSNPRWRESGIV
jgi:hypothetical protein